MAADPDELLGDGPGPPGALVLYPVPLIVKRSERYGLEVRSVQRAPSSGPARGGSAASAFSAVDLFCAARLCGHAGRVTAEHGGFRRGF